MRLLMLAPSPNVSGPISKHTPYLVQALRDLGCEVFTEPWGRHREDESILEKSFGRALDVLRIRRVLVHGRFDGLVVKTAHDWATLDGASARSANVSN